MCACLLYAICKHTSNLAVPNHQTSGSLRLRWRWITKSWGLSVYSGPGSPRVGTSAFTVVLDRQQLGALRSSDPESPRVGASAFTVVLSHQKSGSLRLQWIWITQSRRLSVYSGPISLRVGSSLFTMALDRQQLGALRYRDPESPRIGISALTAIRDRQEWAHRRLQRS